MRTHEQKDKDYNLKEPCINNNWNNCIAKSWDVKPEFVALEKKMLAILWLLHYCQFFYLEEIFVYI